MAMKTENVDMRNGECCGPGDGDAKVLTKRFEWHTVERGEFTLHAQSVVFGTRHSYSPLFPRVSLLFILFFILF